MDEAEVRAQLADDNQQGELMSDAEPLGPVARRLFYTDAEGAPTDPDSAIAAALDGDWERLEPEVLALLRDEAVPAYDRYLALSALATWGSPRGYEEVQRTASQPDAVVWKDELADRRFGADETFALLAEAVAGSADMAEERGTEPQRRAALAALLGLADRYYFERYLSVQCLASRDIAELREPLTRAIEAGLDRLCARESVGFDLGTQVAGLIVALGETDEHAALAYARQLLDTEPGPRTVRELAELQALDT